MRATVGSCRWRSLNLDAREPVAPRRGDRIAQLAVQRVEHAVFHEVQQLPGRRSWRGRLRFDGRSPTV